MGKSKIDWTERTLNPIIVCEKCSEACKNCYAEREAMLNVKRMRSTVNSESGRETLAAYEGALKWENDEPVGWSGEPQFISHVLKKPLSRKEPTIYFVGSMGDVFHDSVPYEWLKRLFDTMNEAHQHTYILLTKRPHNVWGKLFGTDTGRVLAASSQADLADIAPNIYMGVTVENQKRMDERKQWLSLIPATGRFISAEPLLGELDFYRYSPGLDKIDQIIVGGESGENYRAFDWDWVRTIRDTCSRNNVSFFLKQSYGVRPEKLPELDGRQHTDLIWKR